MTNLLTDDTISASSTFGSVAVEGAIARALAAMRYSEPTPIQEQAIPPLRAGRDVLGQAQTGTGKTAGFAIPLIEMVDTGSRKTQAIVLVPTRELCLQVTNEMTRLGQYSGVRVAAVYGGVGLGRQIDALTRGVHLVVGTPGRVEDLLQRGSLRLDGVRVAILDEADRMLDVGFLPAIERILKRTPHARQTALFSATLPDDVRGLAQRHMRDPITVAVDPERATVDEIEQRFERVPDGDKLSALHAHLEDPACFLALVFRRTTYKADRLARDLSRQGHHVAVLHGRRSQSQRERVLSDLKACKVQVLVATDIAARGLDIPGLTHVFNYDLPDTPETYVHRIGRTGRAGETGTAITLIGPEDEAGRKAIERYLAQRRLGHNAASQSRPSPRPQKARNGQARRPNRNPAPLRHRDRQLNAS
ncbi:MAG: DEAD/DEAH box helicase [Chloroflexota bacterium]